MAVYQRLLLSTGGGIISRTQQAAQDPQNASLFIGLGGTGIDALRTIKTQVYERLQQDDPDDVVPKYKHIRFLGIDTDLQSIKKSQNDSDTDGKAKANEKLPLADTEFFSLASPDISGAIANERAISLRKDLQWLRRKDIPTPDLTMSGAGGIRQIGRFLLMDKSTALMNRLTKEIRAAKEGITGASVNIHIFAGISGGTGAGTFLDVCYMVQHVISQVGGGAITFGYFFLPDVNLSNPTIDGQTREYIRKNGYASMQELDYCMQLERNGGTFVQEYKDGTRITWDRPPVQMCHLICATDQNANVLPDAYNYAMNATAEYIMDFLTPTTQEMNLASQLANYRAKVRESYGHNNDGTCLNYCVIGASCATLPLREINTYLASKLFGEFKGIQNNIPSEPDVMQLVSSAWAPGNTDLPGIYEAILSKVMEGVDPGSFEPFAGDYRDVMGMGNSSIVVDGYTNQRSNKIGIAEANMQSLSDAHNAKSLIQSLRSMTAPIMKDIRRGPVYAYDMYAAAQSHNIQNIITGLIKINKERRDQEAYQTQDHIIKDYDTALSNFNNRVRRSLMDNDKKRFADYEYMLFIRMQNYVMVDVYDKVGELLKTVQNQVNEVAESYYHRLAKVVNNLLETFSENAKALEQGDAQGDNSSFAIPLMSITELKPSLDAEIKKIDVGNAMSSLIQTLINNESEWIEEDEDRIARLVTNFFVVYAFGDFVNKTISDFLREKYKKDGLTTDQQIGDRVYRDWMLLLTQKAAPLFFFDTSVWDISQTGELKYLSYPQISNSIKIAASEMSEVDPTWTLKASGLNDRIYAMTTAVGLPLASYNEGKELERVYYSSPTAGRHLYEGTENGDMYFNDWRNLPPLRPQYLIDDGPAPLTAMVDESRALFDRGVEERLIDTEKGIIYQPTESWAAKLNQAIDAADVTADATKAMADVENAKQVLKQLQEAVPIEKEISKYSIRIEGKVDSEESRLRILKDYFVASPAIVSHVKESLQTEDELTAKAHAVETELQEAIDGASRTANLVEYYTNALCTGVISIEGKMIVYHQKTLFGSKDIFLSKLGDTQFAFANIPVYQGFLTFKTMDKSIVDEIKKMSDERVNMGAPEIASAVEAVKSQLTDEKMRAYAMLAQQKYSNAGEILDLLGNIKAMFETFVQLYA